MTAVSRAVVEFLVDWNAYPAGALAVAADDTDTDAGTIATDDTDVAAGTMVAGDWETSFAGTYADLSDRVETLSITAGRDDALQEMQAGEATVTLRDHDGLLNHGNAASPLAGLLDDRMHPARIRLARGGVWRGRFYGFTRRIAWQPQGRRGAATIALVDLFYFLRRAKPVIASTGPTTTGAAIGLILDAIRWLDPAARDLDVGDMIDDFSADGTKTGLDLIAELLEAERGVFYIGGDGRAVYEDRHARLFRTSEATIADRITNVRPEVDFDLVRNRVRVSRVDPVTGDVTYTAEAVDEDSVARADYADADEIRTVYLQSDAQSDALAAWILPLVTEATSPLRAFTVDGRDDDLLDAILDLDLVDRLTVEESTGGTAGDFHVERYTLTVSQTGRLAADYLLSKASELTLLAVATDDADLTVGTIGTDDADTAAGVIVY